MKKDHNKIIPGFPSPAKDYQGPGIDLNKELTNHPQSTFYMKIEGNSLSGSGVEDGDILVIDKSMAPQEGKTAVCFIEGNFTLKRISFKEPRNSNKRHAKKDNFSYKLLNTKPMWLLPLKENEPAIFVDEPNDFTIWGIVTYIIKKL